MFESPSQNEMIRDRHSIKSGAETDGGSEAHYRALAAFVAEHRDQLEALAGSDKETARLAGALLECARVDHDSREMGGGLPQ